MWLYFPKKPILHEWMKYETHLPPEPGVNHQNLPAVVRSFATLTLLYSEH